MIFDIKNLLLNLGSDTFGIPIFQKILQNLPFSSIISIRLTTEFINKNIVTLIDYCAMQ